MPRIGPIKRRDLVYYLRQLGFDGPYSGGKHQIMVRGDMTLRLPNPHRSDIGQELLVRILRQAKITRDEGRISKGLCSAQVVIIGGGVIGTSVAYHLARLGCRDILLLEREPGLGSGSTGRSVGGIRHQFSTKTNIELSIHSIRKFHQFTEETGHPAQFHWVGYLFLLDNEADWVQFQQNVALQQSLGVHDVRLLTPGEARDLVPQLEVDDLLGATFCPRDGFGDPYEVCQGYAAAAKRLGACIRTGVEVTAIDVEHGRVKAVRTRAGDVIVTEWVVNAAGPYAGIVGEMAGVHLPIQPYRRQVFITEAFNALAPDIPMTVDFGPSFYFRREGAGILFGMTDKDEPPSFNLNTDARWLERIIEHALHRVPVLADARVMRGWGGLYDTTPDGNPILGPVPEVQGFLVAAGFSGHGFMHSPMTGQLIAEIIVQGQPSLDLEPLSIRRFAVAAAGAEHNVI